MCWARTFKNRKRFVENYKMYESRLYINKRNSDLEIYYTKYTKYIQLCLLCTLQIALDWAAVQNSEFLLVFILLRVWMTLVHNSAKHYSLLFKIIIITLLQDIFEVVGIVFSLDMELGSYLLKIERFPLINCSSIDGLILYVKIMYLVLKCILF